MHVRDEEKPIKGVKAMKGTLQIRMLYREIKPVSFWGT
jgi:hypothetical protein